MGVPTSFFITQRGRGLPTFVMEDVIRERSNDICVKVKIIDTSKVTLISDYLTHYK